MELEIPAEWAIFPLHGIRPDGACACLAPDCGNQGKHPKWLFSQLTAGEKAPIGPYDGIGLATGERSGCVVIDLDFKPSQGINGLESLADLAGASGIPDTLTVATPTGGFHLYFRWPGWRVKNSVSALGPGIDVRGDGGYVVLPPTAHKRGGVYEFVNWGTPIADLPDWLAARLAASPGGAPGAPYPVPPPPALSDDPTITTEAGHKVIDRVSRILLQLPEGRRNESLFRLCAELGDWSHIGEINLDDARHAVLLGTADWGDRAKTLDTIERGFEKGRLRDHPIVVVGPDHQTCNEQAIDALAKREDVYVIGNRLARDTQGNGLASMTSSNLQEILSRVVDWRTRGKEGDLRRVHPPPWSVSEIFDRGFWPGLRIVDGVSDVPVLRPDGTIATEQGYDPATRVVLRESHKVTPMSKGDACLLLDDLIQDFPFAEPSHRAAWLCSLLTPLAVHAFTGPMPLFLFEASTAGAGKSLLASVTALVSTGIIPPVTMFTDNDDEMRKKITSLAQRPRAVALLDNVGKGVKLGGPALCAILTSPDRIWSDRLLGGNVQFEGRLSTVFFATSNNTEIAEDMDRRICPVRLTPDVERPEKREGFARPDLMGYVAEHRGLLTSAALAILSGYIAAGSPRAGGVAWGSFAGWHALVCGAVEWAGWGSPDGAVEALRMAREVEDGPDLVAGMQELCATQLIGPGGLTAQEILDFCYPPRSILGAPAEGAERLRRVLDGRFPRGVNARNLGGLLRGVKDRVFACTAIRLGGLSQGHRKWCVARV